MPLAIFTLVSSSFVVIGPREVHAAVPGDYTIFAETTSCPSDSKQFDWEGSNSAVIGNVHSNAGILVSGNFHTTDGTATFAAACGVSLSGSGNTFGGAPTPSPAAYQEPPVYPEPTCTPERTFIGDTNLADEAVGGELNGVYCVFGGKLELGASVSGSVTFFTDGAIVLGASGLDLTPFANGVLLHSTLSGPDAITVSGSSSTLFGAIYAPNGEAEVAGQDIIAGCVIGETVKLHGSDHAYVGCDPLTEPVDEPIDEPIDEPTDPNGPDGNTPNDNPGGDNPGGSNPDNSGGTGTPTPPVNSGQQGGTSTPSSPTSGTEGSSQPNNATPAGGTDATREGTAGTIPNTSMAASTQGWLTALGLFMVAMALRLRPALRSSRA